MALVPTKTNVFVSSINHLLCVSTASEIVILGFVLTDPSLPMSPTTQGTYPIMISSSVFLKAYTNVMLIIIQLCTFIVLELVPQPIFVISSDNLRFVVVHGTKSGRIFLGATNGTIHEVGYQVRKV